MLGTINPVAEIARRAHEVGALVVVDASQAAPQLPIDLAAMPVEERPDFLAFTGHKVVGPTGIGVLWGRGDLLDELPPFLGGGEMIETVTMERSTYAPIPHKFEAGTPPIVEAVGLGAAVDYLGRPRHGRRPRARAGDHRATRSRGWPTVPGLTVLGPLDADAARRRDLLRARRRAPARRRAGARLPRHRGPGRPPLRQARARPLRRAELDADVVVPLHDAGRDRRAGRGPGIHPLATSSWAERDGPRLRSTRRSSWTTTSTRTTRGCASPSRPRCTTSTRPAATR